MLSRPQKPARRETCLARKRFLVTRYWFCERQHPGPSTALGMTTHKNGYSLLVTRFWFLGRQHRGHKNGFSLLVCGFSKGQHAGPSTALGMTTTRMLTRYSLLISR